MIIVGIICTIVFVFGIGAIVAFYVHSFRTRNALPAWTRQVSHNDTYGGRR